MKLGLYVHPHDLLPRPEPVLREIASLGFTEIAVAAAYHAGRWTCSRGDTVVRFLEDGVVHFRPGPATSPIRPRPSSLVPAAGPDPIDVIVEAALAAGLDVHAWTVCFHNTPLGSAHPEYTIENAFGERMPYALCPSNPEVRAFAVDLTTALGAKKGLASIELEAAGFLGYVHASHHEKSSFSLGRYENFLMSLCLCSACCAAMRRADLDPDRVRARVRATLVSVLRDGDSLEAPSRLEGDIDGLIDRIVETRTRTLERVLEEVRARLPRGARLTGMVEPDPLFAGAPIAGDPEMLARHLDGMVLVHYGRSAADRRRTWQAMTAVAGRVPCLAAFWPKRPDFAGLEELIAAATECRAQGAAGVRLYHYGLVPPKTLHRAAQALREIA